MPISSPLSSGTHRHSVSGYGASQADGLSSRMRAMSLTAEAASRPTLIRAATSGGSSQESPQEADEDGEMMEELEQEVDLNAAPPRRKSSGRSESAMTHASDQRSHAPSSSLGHGSEIGGSTVIECPPSDDAHDEVERDSQAVEPDTGAPHSATVQPDFASPRSEHSSSVSSSSHDSAPGSASGSASTGSLSGSAGDRVGSDADGAAAGAGGSRSSTTVRCLIAEDNPIAMKVLENMLTKLGCVCTCVRNGADAVSTAMAEIKFALIFLDVTLPIGESRCALPDDFDCMTQVRQLQLTHYLIPALPFPPLIQPRARTVDGEDVARMVKSTRNLNSSTPIVALASADALPPSLRGGAGGGAILLSVGTIVSDDGQDAEEQPISAPHAVADDATADAAAEAGVKVHDYAAAPAPPADSGPATSSDSGRVATLLRSEQGRSAALSSDDQQHAALAAAATGSQAPVPPHPEEATAVQHAAHQPEQAAAQAPAESAETQTDADADAGADGEGDWLGLDWRNSVFDAVLGKPLEKADVLALLPRLGLLVQLQSQGQETQVGAAAGAAGSVQEAQVEKQVQERHEAEASEMNERAQESAAH